MFDQIDKKIKKPGVAVIFNFVDFDAHVQLGPRSGSLKDVKRLKNVFYAMDLEVCSVHNPSLQEFNDAIKNLSKYDFTEFNSMQVVFMSHGDKSNVLFCKDGQFDFVEKCAELFNNPTLQGKPKYIIVEACKGSFNVNEGQYDNNSSTHYDFSQITSILTSSFEGFVSFLSPEDGSDFIKTYVKTLQDSWDKHAFKNIFNDVAKEFNAKRDQQAVTVTSYTLVDTFSYKRISKNLNPVEHEFTL